MSTDERPQGARVTLDMVGSTTGGQPVAWDERDVMLYALGVGAGLDHPTRDLAYTTENSEGVALAVLPSFATIFPLRRQPPAYAALDRGRFLHAEQALELERPLPPSGCALMETVVEGAADKGGGAILSNLTTLRLEGEASSIARLRSRIFVRGGGGFGGPRGEAGPGPLPERAPDLSVALSTRPEQALLYRLSGDRNPLHSDPAFALARGFERPILHGLCTYGVACRALAAAAEGDARRLRAMSGRFTKPVYPGDTLTTEIWRLGPEEAAFRTLDGSGEVVLDRGSARFACPS